MIFTRSWKKSAFSNNHIYTHARIIRAALSPAFSNELTRTVYMSQQTTTTTTRFGLDVYYIYYNNVHPLIISKGALAVYKCICCIYPTQIFRLCNLSWAFVPQCIVGAHVHTHSPRVCAVRGLWSKCQRLKVTVCVCVWEKWLLMLLGGVLSFEEGGVLVGGGGCLFHVNWWRKEKYVFVSLDTFYI